MNQWKLTDLTVKNIFFTDQSVKRQITDSISENLTDSDLESNLKIVKLRIANAISFIFVKEDATCMKICA